MTHIHYLIVCIRWHVFVFLVGLITARCTGELSLCFIASKVCVCWGGQGRLWPSPFLLMGVGGLFLQQIYVWMGHCDLRSSDTLSAAGPWKQIVALCVFQVSLRSDRQSRTCTQTHRRQEIQCIFCTRRCCICILCPKGSAKDMVCPFDLRSMLSFFFLLFIVWFDIYPVYSNSKKRCHNLILCISRPYYYF